MRNAELELSLHHRSHFMSNKNICQNLDLESLNSQVVFSAFQDLDKDYKDLLETLQDLNFQSQEAMYSDAVRDMSHPLTITFQTF